MVGVGVVEWVGVDRGGRVGMGWVVVGWGGRVGWV